MASIYGTKLHISIFGQSHGEAIGVTIDGLPAGKRIDFDELNDFLRRRAPGGSEYVSTRSEDDVPEILSGIVDGTTCGAPLCAVIRNHGARTADYEGFADLPRPSHADYTAQLKYGGYQDARGGGHFSGRLTAPLCIAGGICLQILREKGIEIAAHISSIGGISDTPFDPVSVSEYDFTTLSMNSFPVVDSAAGERMINLIAEAKSAGNSLGGIIECAAIGVPGGLGDPIFDGMENRISQVVFGIPAIKGIEFGNGFDAAAMSGFENNDGFYFDESGEIKTYTNNHGGILGGITSGMPLIFRVAVKPTPSIAVEQNTVDLLTEKNAKIKVAGRHDPCIVPRAVPCVEAAAAIALLDAVLDA